MEEKTAGVPKFLGSSAFLFWTINPISLIDKGKVMKKYFYAFLILVILLSFGDRSEAKNLYSYQKLGTSGWTSIAYGINNLGNVVGQSYLAGESGPKAFLWTKHDGMRNLGTIGGLASSAKDINELNQVVGEASTINGDSHAFFWSRENGMRDLGTLGSTLSQAYSINNSSQVVGTSGSQAFLWTNQDGMRDLGNLGSPGNCIAFGINNSGQIVGESKTTSNLNHACLWENDLTIKDLNTLGGNESLAFGINDHGQIVGVSDTDISGHANGHAFLWIFSEGMKDLGTIGGVPNYAYNINNIGYIVGSSSTDRAFLWTPTDGMQDLNDLVIDLPSGLTLRSAFDINDLGQIVGSAKDINDISAFILNPVPLPSALLLLGAGLGRLAIYRRRKASAQNITKCIK